MHNFTSINSGLLMTENLLIQAQKGNYSVMMFYIPTVYFTVATVPESHERGFRTNEAFRKSLPVQKFKNFSISIYFAFNHFSLSGASPFRQTCI